MSRDPGRGLSVVTSMTGLHRAEQALVKLTREIGLLSSTSGFCEVCQKLGNQILGVVLPSTTGLCKNVQSLEVRLGKHFLLL